MPAPADRGRGPLERHGDHFVAAEPEPFHVGPVGRVLDRVARMIRRIRRGR